MATVHSLLVAYQEDASEIYLRVLCEVSSEFLWIFPRSLRYCHTQKRPRKSDESSSVRDSDPHREQKNPARKQRKGVASRYRYACRRTESRWRFDRRLRDGAVRMGASLPILTTKESFCANIHLAKVSFPPSTSFCTKPRLCPLDGAHTGDKLQTRFSCGLGIK